MYRMANGGGFSVRVSPLIHIVNKPLIFYFISSILDLNIPVCGVAAFLVFMFLRLRTPQGTIREKLARID